mmetsp:Transcript_30197/g.64099  ORF Transcript_30197/g.64099 Transcript_30197/m.64099 type:complete len:107 (+) Transcript_30197:1870-2190(+)|eukprot:CAMPEP_0172531690 /NCGR_PEP_ID=MMETSP1067-20121228/4985_1 /TAXON_ID=265564 ORGANISM="Thalassiosira punctigera, Strain Tpunct2005C2" /NCGR_SAMPLE_ID=MMETSP1067 /ASSEMBLY_ACC=CAM_ASM_000444 /LENGTH=106 /DNA_ID=CAMNT_0013316093 /DNA_START=862 /DNA_END=1182 /DNA_ORIENTATION=-
MTNPITAWIKSCMETHEGREAWMVERVSENSINSQKFADERHSPYAPHDVYRCENRTHPNFRPAFAVSGYAGQEAGNAGSFRAMRYYQSGFSKRRDEIMTEIAKSG